MAKRKDHGFLDKFLGNDKVEISKLKKNAIKHDKFDEEDYQHLMNEMREFNAAEDRLTDAVATGGSAYADMFYSLLKAEPKLENPNHVRPTHRINHAVAREAMGLKEYEEMRLYSTGDEIAAGLANITMEPELETLFDKLQQEQKMAEELQQKYDQMQQLEDEEHDLDEMMRRLEEDGDGSGDQEQQQNFQDQKSKIEEAMRRLQEGMDAGDQELDQALNQQSNMIKQAMKDALNGAIDEAEEMEMSATTWGLDPGYLHRLPPQERLEMSRRLNSDKFKRIAQIFGPMHRMAFAEQQRKTIHSNDEIYDVEIGNDLGRILASELMNLADPTLKLDFIRRFFEGELLQYKLRGEEKLAKGAIICCVDGSGSMAGENEIWSKAVALTLLQIAKSQKREFYAIEFGGPGMMYEYDFRDPKSFTPENVIRFAEAFLNGGTDFMTPLSRSLDLLREEHERRGAVKADVVFITDGECGVGDSWLEQFKAEQQKLAFRIYGVAIGCSRESEPLYTICDKRVLTLKNLTSGEDLRDIFRSV